MKRFLMTSEKESLKIIHVERGIKMKILASDLDGTLYFGDQKDPIRTNDREAIHAFQKAGNAFGICSGRTLAGIHHALDGRDIDLDFYILVSGAALADHKGNYIYQHTLSISLIRAIIEAVDTNEVSVLFCHDEDYYRMKQIRDANDPAKMIHNIDEAPDLPYDSLHFAFKKDDPIIEYYKEKLIQLFHEQVEVHHNVNNLDIAPKGCTKGNAIQTLPDYYPIRFEDIFVIGDSYNDISMLSSTPNAFTFHSSPDEVKKHAKYIVNSISEAIDIINNL